MKTNWQTKKLGVMKKAWLVQWNFYAKNENKRLKQCGITKKIVDIISIRKTFEQVIDIAKDIYRRERLSYSEKVFLANYSKGKKRKNDFFSTTLLNTNYQTDLYKNYMRSFRDNGMHSPITEKLFDQWKKYPTYVTIGHNPTLEIRLVYNFIVKEDENGKEILKWDDPLADGTYKKEKHEN
ncbi:hypothetical protein KKD57_02485 [Patescibacteria group bacterium]|nr:hypothetical protein [Patescibacteria group bacterium]